MDVSTLKTVTNRTGVSQAPSGKKDLGKDEFLTLLTTQMQAQDPLNPMDNTEFVAQLSQFTSLERLENMSSSIESMALSMSSNTSAQMVSFIGKSVVARSSEMELGVGGKTSDMTFDLGAGAEEVKVTIKDETGRVVRTMELGEFAKGEHTLSWDGLKDDGGTLATGSYSVSVEAKNAEGEDVGAQTYSKRKVKGVSYENGVPRLDLEGELTIGLGEIRQVNQ